jgi:hypothetical protein
MMDKIVEVISVIRAVESATGESLFQIQFGQMVDVDDNLRKYIPQLVGSVPPKKQGLITLVLFADLKGTVPYKVGSKWRVSIGESGALSLKEVKK